MEKISGKCKECLLEFLPHSSWHISKKFLSRFFQRFLQNCFRNSIRNSPRGSSQDSFIDFPRGFLREVSWVFVQDSCRKGFFTGFYRDDFPLILLAFFLGFLKHFSLEFLSELLHFTFTYFLWDSTRDSARILSRIPLGIVPEIPFGIPLAIL